MYVLNISHKVNHTIIYDWIEWQKNIFIPSLLDTGLAKNYQFYKLLEHDDDEGSLYVLQFHFTYHQDLRVFEDQYEKFFLPLEIKKWGDQFISFKTTLKNITN
ncbi:MAG: DUF4286 family protein [Bacteroidetes bacterium]|nr:DUF4286 family protein [Bacteroidota bacterium]